MTEIPESIVLALAHSAEINDDYENSAAYKCLAEATEIRARGNLCRFMLTENGELCVQEGIGLPQPQHSSPTEGK